VAGAASAEAGIDLDRTGGEGPNEFPVALGGSAAREGGWGCQPLDCSGPELR
jgi:hypothetical protein